MNKTSLERLYNGLVKENPTFVLMLGMCPTLAVTTSAINGMGMGLTTAVVLALSNVIISLMRKIIPSKVRIPAFIVIIASFVTVVQLLLEAYLPSLNEALGVYIPLIVVNCIILGRAEAYAYFNPPIPSLFDGIGMGLGFTVALTMLGAVREVLGAASIFGIEIPGMVPIGIFVLAPGAFFVLATLTAIQNFIKIQGQKRGKDMSKIQSGCDEDCMNCGEKGCSRRFFDADATRQEQVTETVEKKNADIDIIDLDDEESEKPEETVKAKEVENPKQVEPSPQVEEMSLETKDVSVEEKPKRKPRKKTVKVEETVKAQETEKIEQEESAPQVEEMSLEAKDVSVEEKPKRKPRKKTVKVEETGKDEETEKLKQVDSASQEEKSLEAENLSVEENTEEKPKRRPRKKAVKPEETVKSEETEELKQVEPAPQVEENTEEKPKRKPRKKTVKVEETVKAIETEKLER
ncbi:MAG: electron transport complex subunit RsxE, partial [Lachnospiraceae bacterium]|nr:electron transport complex subunit RsxE [Lachnospiraceae bacterium]